MIFKVIVKLISWLWFLFLVCILLSYVIYNISQTVTKIKVYLLSKEDKNQTELSKTNSESSCVAIFDLREKTMPVNIPKILHDSDELQVVT